MATIQTNRSLRTTTPTPTSERLAPAFGGNLATKETTNMTANQGPTASDCERAGCMEHCACKPNDPWIYAVVGVGVGGIVFGGVLYYVGKNRKRTRR